MTIRVLALAAVLLATLTLSSCGVYFGLRSTSPHYKGPGPVERWWQKHNTP